MTPGLILFAPSFLSIKVKEQIFNFYHAETSFSRLFLGWLGLKLDFFFSLSIIKKAGTEHGHSPCNKENAPNLSVSNPPRKIYIIYIYKR